MSTTKRLRVGLIGAGTIAFSAHLPAIRKLRDSLELVAVADIRLENAERAAREFDAESHYADYRDLLAREDLDFVDICTPEFLHAEQVEAAAAAGVHVICEKPMASSIAEADRMIAASERAGIHLMIAHSRRFTGRYQQIRAAIDRGDIGEVRYFRENERRPRSMYDGLGLGTGYWNPEEGRPWLTMARYSQGAALTNAVHETDLARWFIGQQPVSVYAEARITESGAEVPDMLTYTIQFANGAIGASEIVNQLPRGYPYFHMTEVIGTNGRIRATDPIMSPYTVADERGIAQPVNFPTLLHVDQAYVEELAAFTRVIRDGERLPITPQEARGAVELSVAAVISSRRAAPVSLPLTDEEANRD
ncbi:MAG TPA: Gfo/Idh/MocA family oxidoreductase [Thermomicrobiales bacterium]|nr:Gfo/Idh/MocA family oxidoreductase [Thermomicrobiales bacterium]